MARRKSIVELIQSFSAIQTTWIRWERLLVH